MERKSKMVGLAGWLKQYMNEELYTVWILLQIFSIFSFSMYFKLGTISALKLNTR